MQSTPLYLSGCLANNFDVSIYSFFGSSAMLMLSTKLDVPPSGQCNSKSKILDLNLYLLSSAPVNHRDGSVAKGNQGVLFRAWIMWEIFRSMMFQLLESVEGKLYLVPKSKNNMCREYDIQGRKYSLSLRCWKNLCIIFNGSTLLAPYFYLACK